MEDKKVELTDKMKGMMDTIEKMTVMELADLVKALEEKFGVTAAAPMMMAAGGAAAGGAAEAAKDEFDLVLTAAGDKKIQVLKVLREITGLGLKEAKDLVDNAPKTVKEKIKKEEAAERAKDLT